MDEAYINCLSSLSKILLQRNAFQKQWDLKGGSKGQEVYDRFQSKHLQEILSIYEEAQRWLGTLSIYYPDKQDVDFEVFNKQVREFNIHTGDNGIRALHDSVLKLASDDVRFQLHLPKGLEDIKRGKLKE